MRKPLVLTLAFIGSMVVGALLLLFIVTGIGFVQIAIQERNHSGIGVFAGGISEVLVFLVPFLFGVIGVLITLRRIERRKP